jgi:UPF0716 protein FxsA
MFALVAAVLVVMAVIEIYVIVLVAQGIGALNTILLLLVCSLVGAWLAKREGFGVLGRIRDRVAAREPPTNELIDGALILLGGLLLLLPGFVSDVIGVLLLIPPTRALARSWVKRRFRVRVYGVAVPRPSDVRNAVRSREPSPPPERYVDDDVIDVDPID